MYHITFITEKALRMVISKDDYCIFNEKLLTLFGLSQILNPKTFKIGGRNAYHILLSFGLVLPTIITSLSIVFGLHRWMKDIFAVGLYMAYMTHHLFSCCKMVLIFYYSNKLWECYKISGSSFGIYLRYSKHIFQKWWIRSTRLSLTIIITCIAIWVIWFLCPRIFDGSVVKIKNIEDSWDVYKLNAINLYFFVSDKTYNEHFNIFYCLEIIVLSEFMLSVMLFNLIIVTMCMTISCQLERISDAIQLLGEKPSLENSITSTFIFIFLHPVTNHWMIF